MPKNITPQTVLITAAVLVVLMIAVCVKSAIDKKKGQSGEDLAKVRQVLFKLLPDCSSYTTAYAHFIKQDKVIGNAAYNTYYYHYAVAFKSGALFVVPIKCTGGEISYSDGIMLTPETVGQVTAKKGWTHFWDRQGQEVCALSVCANNTRIDKYHPFNIQQPEEAKAFEAFCSDFTAQVNSRV